MKKSPLSVRLALVNRAPSEIVMTEHGELLGGSNAGNLGGREFRRMAARLAKKEQKKGGRR
ncbi:hypothetical protein [Aquabacterium sp. A08]|uniref:hypothetical protein n=1 Tax=Aquabacterium sp. A08 TaxID=2718532 RepID=UPI00141EEAA9|nr:hypothetical protein [Aquabacterium sp. A08]NIC43315.1 hypothetical protein [Aquabacterium sp. A08]